MTWSEIDWQILSRLRDRFLRGVADPEPYWQGAADLENYDFTYAERIGWKWDHVLRELHLRQWRPRSRNILDWGCGSGVAARRVIAHFGIGQFDTLTVWDHSPIAADFAASAAQRQFPALEVTQATPGLLAANEPIGLLVISHVLNELVPTQHEALRTIAERADEIMWVEPGTHEVSRQLGAIREQLRPRGFRVVAPCTHQLECPMFAEGNARHWCHFFAPPPSEIFADSNWVKFGQRAGIDLRSLPYCFLALARERVSPISDRRDDPDAGQRLALLSRVIGRPEHFKPYARLLNCDATGLTELELPKRADPALFKELERTKAPLVYRWQRDANKILAGTSVGTEPRDPES